ncbi:galactan 5-O-arabinofuranosyltransferase [Corynebacterium heidelbergense]|uniref:Galactan 5-O-arabinofuranosyltransferase n=1 Tax=Corynebacterium heidelbergense TaxID=2055947 RepID=A0A364V463_9CORY|nr:galactan 5-O-arabinofuranosyltransferase [Corynebacterium heidelbergense]RAV31435.1 hypothetical protein DLJ54_08360 [Corynebacterium heidelbergense]
MIRPRPRSAGTPGSIPTAAPADTADNAPAIPVSHTTGAQAPAIGNLGRPFTKDAVDLRTTLAHMLLAGGAAAVITLACWFALGATNLPSFNSSFVTKALSTAATVIVIGAAAGACFVWLTNRPAKRRYLLSAALYLVPAGLVVTTLAIPLAATSLYLDGISVDQAFRTQYLTRMTDHLGWADMAYLDQPSFYPGLWFFSGGLFAKLTGMAGWAAYKPWALVTLSATASMLVPVWRRITGSLVIAVAVALVSTAVTLAIAAEEPYAAIVAMGMPAAVVLARRAMRGGRGSLLGLIVFLGLSANLYTLYTGLTAIITIALAISAAAAGKTIRPILRLGAAGIASMAIAAIGWGPYLLALATRPHGPTGKAQHYLPDAGTFVPTPFFQATALGALTLLGLIWLIMRSKRGDARALIVGLSCCYAWVVASMIMALVGTTLLGFRLDLPISLMLAAAGVLALADIRIVGVRRLYPQTVKPEWSRIATRIMAIVLALGCLNYACTIPINQRDRIDLAYTDSDGEAHRGDRFPADATQYYAKIDTFLSQRLKTRAGSVILTDEKSFLAYYPYHGYQALTAHYANPLGQFEKRNDEIESWTDIKDPQKMLDAMDKAQADNGWHSPDAIVLRGQLSKGKVIPKERFSYLIADDIYPNQPNVRFRTVNFHTEAFASGWDLGQIGPFVVAVRERDRG